MKLVNHSDVIIAIIEHAWEKAYLISQQGKQEWVPLFLTENTTPIAEINPISRLVRLCPGQKIADTQGVLLHAF